MNINRRSKIIPARLREAREAQGFKQSELAQKLGISRQAISEYEQGTSHPSPKVFMDLIQHLDIPLAYLTMERLRKTSLTRPINFRQFTSATSISRKKAQKREEWCADIYEYLVRMNIKFPDVQLPKFGRDVGPSHGDFESLSMGEIDAIAQQTRQFWNLGGGPITNLCLLLENKGIIVSRVTVDQKLDAFSSWRANRPFIFLNQAKTAVRSRFDAAHELGHLVLHPSVTSEDHEDKKTFKYIEDQANRFASAFLLPTQGLQREMISLSLSHLTDLKKRWKVAIAAIARRAKETGLISDNQSFYIFRQLNALPGGRKREPLDDSMEPEQPVFIERAIRLLVDNHVKTPDEIRDDLALNLDVLCELTRIPNDYFGKPPGKLFVIPKLQPETDVPDADDDAEYHEMFK